MFFFPILNSVILIYVLAAIVPAIFLLRWIYKKDRIEKEPPQTLVSLIGLGVAAALVSALLERAGELLLYNLLPNRDTIRDTAILAFLIVAVVEEGTKFAFCYRKTWYSRSFDCRFDGIVYMAFTSLGFAAFENILYVFRYGLAVAGPRAVLSVPGHLGFAVVAGAMYGRAKQHERRGNLRLKTVFLILAYILAVLLHGFYDFCAMTQTTMTNLLFVIFVAAMYLIVILLVRGESRKDQYI
jgi:RsiW-degrading membrane proteinase PrsW (M82 family)